MREARAGILHQGSYDVLIASDKEDVCPANAIEERTGGMDRTTRYSSGRPREINREYAFR
jgi:hypothetical protein